MLPTGAPHIYGIFGYPVHHTLSPVMQNAAFRTRKLPALYIPFAVPPETLGSALRGLVALGIRGVNLTIPHKERSIVYMDELTPEAQNIGAVNSVKVTRGRLVGHNTDGTGFLLALQHDLGVKPKGKTVAIIGAGGAAKAIASALLSDGAEQLFLYNRSKNRLLRLVQHLRKCFPNKKDRIFTEWLGTKKIQDLKGIELLVQATSVGMDGKSCLVEPSALHRGMSIYETIYSPAETPFLKMAYQQGLRRANGIGMLIYQGALAFEWWTDQEAPVGEMRKALTRVIRKFARLK